MQNDELQGQLRRLIDGVMNGKMSRREAIRRATVLGISAPVAASLIRSGVAMAQSTPEATALAPGHSIVVPEGLRTDLAGQRISVVLADASSPSVPFSDAAHARFTEVTGIEINSIPGEQSTTDRLAIYNQQFAAQSSDIDVVQIDVIHPGILAQHAFDLAPALSEQASMHFQAIVENNTVNGALIAMPWFTDAGLFWYRTDLLEKYGLSVPMTWSEFETAAQTIQEGERSSNPDFYGFVFQGNAYEGLTCNGLEWQYSNGGGRIVEDVEGTPTVTLNNEAAIASFERARSWVGNIAPEGVTTYQEPDSLNVFQAGNAAFLRNWPYVWATTQVEGSPVNGLVDVGSIPMGEGEGASHAATLGGWQLMVSKYSQATDAAVEYVKYMTSPEIQKAKAIENSNLPTIASVYDDADVAAASEFIPRLKEVFQGGAVARPSSVTSFLYNDVSIAYFTGLNQVLTGQAEAAAAVEDITSQIEDIISEL